MSFLKNFNYQILGEPHADKLVFLHGLMGAATNWRQIASQFESQYQILLFDQRGHGRSFHPAEGYSPTHYATDLFEIIKELGWNSILLVGHSMGGRNALEFATKFPQCVNALVLEDISPENSLSGQQRIENLIEMVPTPFVNRASARKFFKEEFALKIPENSRAQDLANFFYTNIVDTPSGEADWRFSKAGILATLREGRTKDRWQDLESIQVPTLVIRGSESEDLPQKTYEKMLKSHSLIEGVEIGPSGHWVHFDQPKKFIDSIQNFFTKLQ